MSGNDGWANQIGTTAYATTPSGSIPQYSLGLDAGTAQWTDQQTFKTFVEDSVTRNRTEAKDVAAKKQQDDRGWFQKALGVVGGAASFAGRELAQGVGFIAGGPTQDYNPEQDLAQGKDIAGNLWAPIGAVVTPAYRAMATPFIASQQAYKTDGWWLTDPSDWSQAWQLSEERSPGQALVDWVLQGQDPKKSQKDLDRLKRTSSIYGVTALAGDLALGWRLDPTVIAGKGLGEARRIRAGEMPRQVTRPNLIPGQPQRAGTAYPNAARGFLGEDRLGNSPAAHYGYWRGQRIARNLPELRQAAQEMSPADFANMPMFRRRNANNGAAAAELLQIAAKDDKLWDLTARAMMPDPKAWAEIQLMKDGVNPLIPDDELTAAIARGEVPPDQRSYLDALEAQKSKFDKLDKEVQDLEKVLTSRTPGKGGFYEYYSKELHATYESRVADLQDLESRLNQYNDYKSWLDGAPSIDNPGTALNVVKVKPATFDYLSQRTYQKNLWGPVHTVHEITKAGWLKAANPIELHRVDSGARAIRAQFEQMQHLLDYRAEPGVIDATLSEFTRRVMAGNTQGAAMLVRDLEANHLVAGLAQRHGLSPEVVTDWLNAIRSKQGDMVGKLLSGDGAIYTTAPGQGAKIVRKLEDSYLIEVTEGARRHTIKVPTAAFEGMQDTANLAQDVVQTPNYYTPLSVRQLHLAIKRDPELFRELESGYQSWGREWVGKTMNTIDSLGGKWNRFWKPLQLFRLAWPQRVLMDEGLRGMAMLGVSSWMNNYGAAFANASINAFNPYHHPVFGPTLAGAAAGTLAGGPLGGALGAMAAGTAGSILKRRSLRIGPGPIADELAGRVGATEVHIPEDAPSVPSRFVTRPDAKRMQALAEARLLPEPGERAYRKAINSVRGSKKGYAVVNPLSGRKEGSGYAIPIYSAKIRTGDAFQEGLDTEAFIAAHRDLLASPGYRVMVRDKDGQLELSVVRHFKQSEARVAAEFSHHVENDYMVDLRDGGLEYHREWLPDEVRAMDEDIARLESLVEGVPEVVEAPGRIERLMDAMKDLPALRRRRELAKGYIKFRAADGSIVEAQAAFEGPGEIYEALVSGAPAYARLTDTYRRTLSRSQMKAVGYKRLLPPDLSPGILKTRGGQQQAAEYYTAWADLLNDQIRNSPIWSKMLEGQTDEQIVSWLHNSSAGARLRKTLPHKGYDPERWVEEHRQALDFYLPRTDLQALLRERRINPSELRRIGREDMPEVYGPDLEMIEGSSPLGNWWGRQVERIYTALGTTPTDKLSRQPFFKGMYDLRMANLIKSVDPEALTEEMIQNFSRQSREFALRQVRRTMYELGDDTNMTEALRFLAPFWGAQQEALMKWMSIAIERPETVARFYMGTNAAYDRLEIIDEDGNPVAGPDGEWKGFGYNPNHRINFKVPKALRNVEPFKTLLAGQDNIRTSFGSLNTALQGDKPFLPSLGPILSVPADVFINAMWDTHGTEFDDNFFYRWLFPIGRPASGIEGKLDYVMPGWGRRLEQLRQGMDARTYANTWYSVQRELTLDAERKGVRPPTNEEIDKAVKWHFALRTIASFAGPVSLEFAPKHQFYLDEFHKLQQQLGPQLGFEKFVQKYGADAARFAASSSQSVGVPPTALGMKEWKSNDRLIQMLHETGQDDLISAVISPDAWADDFSSDAYAAQFDIKLGPGSKDTLRETVGPAERTRAIDARLGWIEYRQLDAAINAELFANGFTSTQQAGAEQIAEAKRFKVQELAQKYPAWAEQYNTFSNTIYSTVEALRGFVGDKRFDNRPDMQGVRQYLLIRDQVTNELERYAAETGGSRNLQADENTALRQWFYQQVGQLVQDNPAFGEFYSRYLDTDSLERGAG